MAVQIALHMAEGLMQLKWCAAMGVLIWTHWLWAKSPSPRISHREKLTKYVMSRAARGLGCTNTHPHADTFPVAKKKKRQLCSLWIIRARAEPRRQSLASWEQGSPDEASLFKSSGWAASVSVDGIAPGDMHKLGGRISQESGSEKKDGETDGDRKV